MATVEFYPSEPVTSITHLDINGGEAVSDPISMGYYTNSDGEVWIDQGGKRVQIPAEHFNTIIKQLRRAKRLADEAAAQEATQ